MQDASFRDQVHRDLFRHISERHDKWIAHAVDTYDMADIPVGRLAQDVYSILMAELCRIAVAVDLPEKMFTEVFRLGTAKLREKREKREAI